MRRFFFSGAVVDASRGNLLQGNSSLRHRLVQASRAVQNPRLAAMLQNGIGFHVSTLALNDRRMVEQLFLDAALPVLCCTSGL